MNRCDWNSWWYHKKAWRNIVVLVIVQEVEWNAFCPLIFTAKVKVQTRHSMLGNILRNENAKYMSKGCLPLFLRLQKELLKLGKREFIESSLSIALPSVPWHEVLTWLLLLWFLLQSASACLAAVLLYGIIRVSPLLSPPPWAPPNSAPLLELAKL